MSVYEQELADLKEREEVLKKELEKKEEIIEHKNRAIETTKNKLKNATSSSEIEDLRKELETLKSGLQGSEVKRMIAKISTDPAERELIERHYNSSIRLTGNLEDDVQNALAIANRSVVMEQKRNRAMEEQNEDFLASFAKGGSATGNSPKTYVSNPIQREAEELVRSINPNAVKFVKDQFN